MAVGLATTTGGTATAAPNTDRRAPSTATGPTLGAGAFERSLGSLGRLLQAGPTEPQSPFLCTTEFNGLGQPTVDNDDRRGTPVYPLTAGGEPDRAQDPLGWSERCQAPGTVEYRYRTTGGGTAVLPPGQTDLPADIAYLPVADMLGADQLDVGGATQIPYLFRFERGTLPENRFLYSIAMLVPFEEYTGETGGATTAHWNGRLLFNFGGGVGIGHSQGDLSTGAATMDEALRLGHAVLYSSGTRTSTHYNLMLGGRTALELKALFVAEHGQPTYTVGIGGSGGGIQQYVYAQNHPGLLDAAIPQYSYADMATQVIHVGDCELLEHYMDVTDGANPRWTNWDNRRIVQGQNTLEGFTSTWQTRTGDTGSSECIEGWRGATPLAMNPNFGLATRMDAVIIPYAAEIVAKLGAGEPPYPDDFPDIGRYLRVHTDRAQWVDWSHFDDVEEVYGTDPDTGYARVPWDNVGVQYGLRAVANGDLTPEEFLHLNARIGSWKETEDMVPESCGMVAAMTSAELGGFANLLGFCEGPELDQYSARQMNLGTPDAPAPRREADVDAITAAFESGLVFDGRLPREIPMIDSRHYLEHRLDMHNVHQSFGVRERIRRTQGHADNQLIWFLDARPSIDAAATFQLHIDGFRLIDDWVGNIQANPGLSVGEAKPAGAVDRCWDTDGTEIASGDDVWSGAEELILSGEGDWTGSAPTEVDGVPVGPCAAHFPFHSSSRIVAGGPITADVYKCHTKPVAQAIAEGDYGIWTPTAEQQAELEAIHPEGVCDFSRRTVGLQENSPPVATDLAVTTPAGTPVDLTLTATDPDGDPLTYQLTEDPDHGTLSGEAPELTYTPEDGFTGTDTILWTAHDGQAASEVATVTITVAEQAVVPTTTPEPPTTQPDPTTSTTGPAAVGPPAAPPPGGSDDGWLPYTGSALGALALAGLALLLGGSAAVRATRTTRRRPDTAT